MATSIRGNAINGKEKKGTSPSSTLKKTPKPSLSTSTPNDEKTISSTNTTKPLPNYLKPTISSSLDTKKPTFTRMKSIDRPPPASQAQRPTRAGPSPTGPKPERSSSFSNRSISSSSSSSSSSSRPGTEKLYARTSSLKDGKVNRNLSKSLSQKRSTFTESTKKNPTSSSRKKGPKSSTSESSVDCENRALVDHLILEDELENLDKHEIQSLPEMSEMPDSNEELGDPTNVNEEEKELNKLNLDDQIDHDYEKKSMVDDENQLLEDIEPDNHQFVIEKSDFVEGAGDQEHESIEDQQEEVEEKVPEMEEVKEEVEEKVPELEEVKEEIKVEVETERETKVEEVDPSNAKDERETVSSSQSSSTGQKEKQDYNDVIEETATKLMGGKKKNKVLALAGAFETVISLQDTNKN